MADLNSIYTAHRSSLDASINFTRPDPRGGMIETRFVQRTPERFIVYISSMLGCDKACRFCHLTQLGETNATCLSEVEMLDQARTVLAAVGSAGAQTVHFNFMARGEAMSNPSVGRELFKALARLAETYGLKTRIKLSSILPLDIWTNDPSDIHDADCPPVDLYYSLYSVSPEWRRRWIPKAMAPARAMEWLKTYQDGTGQRVVLHWALIDGENDGDDQALAAAELARAAGLNAEFNLVRYNPANEKSRESSADRIDSYMAAMGASLSGRTKTIPRVGSDVSASCGMFMDSQV